MLSRVLEPEVMDSEEDAKEYEAIDNTSVNLEFVMRTIELAPTEGRVLDIGTGPADIAILLAQRASGLRILAVDLGEHMLALARRNVASAGLEHRVEVARADAKATGQSAGTFDMVLCNSLVHHIPEPLDFFKEVSRVARPGAALFLKDLHRPATEAEHRHLVETYASDCTEYQRRLFSDSLRAALTVEEVEELCTRAGLDGVSVRRSSDRHWVVERRAAARA